MQDSDLIAGMLDLESIMSPEGFSVYLGDDWAYAYKMDQLKAGLESWAKMNIATSAVEAWLVKPINDGILHKRSDLKFNLDEYTRQGNHIIGVSQDLTSRYNIASYAYVISDTFTSRDGQIKRFKWTAARREPGQIWHVYVQANAHETFEAICSSRIDKVISVEDARYLYFKLDRLEQTGDIAYTVTEVMNESQGESWAKYIERSRLNHVHEIISLDTMLCENVLVFEEHVAYWNTHFCDDLDYLCSVIRESGIKKPYQILAIMREPTEADMEKFKDDRFVFRGFDLIEDQTQISALTNCGGFDMAFSARNINEHGLITEYADAHKIKMLLRLHYPNEDHAHCAVWAIWRME